MHVRRRALKFWIWIYKIIPHLWLNAAFCLVKKKNLQVAEDFLQKFKDKRDGKDRHFCLGGRLYSIPCRASCFA